MHSSTESKTRYDVATNETCEINKMEEIATEPLIRYLTLIPLYLLALFIYLFS